MSTIVDVRRLKVNVVCDCKAAAHFSDDESGEEGKAYIQVDTVCIT
jgi:hypothetical protein